MKPGIMELGGHAPVIMCDDMDPISSAGTSAIAKSRNAGQVCGSPTCFFVEDAIYDRFADAFAEKAATIRVGNGLDPDNQMGPLANDRRLAAMETLVADAKAKGARITAGGSRIGNRGYFFPLTVLADVPDDARAMREEPFRSLALLSRVRDREGEFGAAWPGRLRLHEFGAQRGPASRRSRQGRGAVQQLTGRRGCSNVKARTEHWCL